MDIFQIKYALEHITCIVDSREQDTIAFRRRIKSIGYPIVREKLDFGDYSAKCTLENGTEISMKDNFSVERKMSLDEICACYGKERSRFTREFERAKVKNAKLYLLIENGTWEKAYAGDYRSRMSTASFTASLTAWLARYNCQLIFCEPRTTPKLIHDILYRETKEYLEHMEDAHNG